MLSLGPFTTGEAALRLGMAVVFGAAIGINRNLHGKSAGLRTHSLVALGSALIMIVALQFERPILEGIQPNFLVEYNAVSRVLQGILQGIGFIGAGIILHSENDMKVKGLTTAASVWIAALIGAGCGVAAWNAVTIAFLLTMLLLAFGGPFEKLVHNILGRKDGED